ncbi:hypothetical protein B9Z55_007473 [Caenorhabditis nigoni]|uniref:Ubiquitin-like domain-containing protein n=1 Tax=Caenorhabditis nigoni TaxID=1611254 RepID=A0A2G5V9X3_9PELO|nr:hypothetical protein B9Z55_007473 [Caenorhabditis nigoni]
MNDREEDPNGIIPETVEIEFINRWSAFNYHYNAKSSDTIEMLKLHYQNVFKVSAQHLFFFSKRRKLENHQTLEFYGIRNFAVVHIEVRSHLKLISMPILAFLLVMAYWEERVLCKNKKEQDQTPEMVEIKFKRSFNFSDYYYVAKRSDTVGMLKLHYQKAFRIPEQHLCFYSNFIDNNGEELIEIIPETIEIKFATSHYSYYYTARSSDTIGMLKLHYQNAFRIPEQRLIFFCEWRKLENHRSLASYGMQGFAVIQVIALSRSDVIWWLILAFLLVMVTLQGSPKTFIQWTKLVNNLHFQTLQF